MHKLNNIEIDNNKNPKLNHNNSNDFKPFICRYCDGKNCSLLSIKNGVCKYCSKNQTKK